MASAVVEHVHESDAEEFYDCNNDIQYTRDDDTGNSSRNSQKSSNGVMARQRSSNWTGRRCLPATMVSRNDFSLWSFLKLCIGKELSKITMPIVFNEPLSFLQRFVEYMEYAQVLLERASEAESPLERMEYVTAFAVSATASNWERTGKPFNPLLGETYEFESREFGFRVVCEQVEHHPPITAFHVESANYTFHGNINPKVKFWGSSVQVTPKGVVTLLLHKHNESYSWQNVSCSVHNIIIGKIWVEHYGEMEVINHKTKHRSVLQFKPCGWMGTELHKVHGYLYDGDKKKIRSYYGKWIEALFSCDVNVWDRLARSSWRDLEEPSLKSNNEITELPVDVPQRGTSCNLHLPGQKLLWEATMKPEDSHRYYNFTLFAMMLNELDPRLESTIAPTDSRLRPDMRLMEQGDIERASAEKNRLEEKQREARKERRKSKEEWKPRWFRMCRNAFTKADEWQFTGEYWKRDWTNCPSIF